MPFTRLRQSLIQPNGSITGSLLGTASYAVTSSYAMNGGSGGGSTPVVSVASLNNQTILYNFSSSQEATITGLTLTNNNWGINVVEEWNSGSGDIYYPSCSLLMHFSGSNGSTTFIDNSPSVKSISGVGNAQISTTQSKFGGSSGYFDGSSYLIQTTNITDYIFGTGDFTIECWLYFNSTASEQGILGFRPQTTNGNYPSFYYLSGTLRYNSLGVDRISFSVSSNIWYHIALSRQGTSTKLFSNGVQQGSTFSDSTDYTAARFILGSNDYNTSTNYFQGYIDELRITKGVARYTGNFTPQTSAFANNASVTQYATKYVGLIGGLNDKSVDYGVQKLSDSSLKVVKMTQTTSPFPSGSLSSSVDRVYVNVLDYSKVNVTSSYATRTLTASYALNASGGGTGESFHPFLLA